MPIKSKAQYGFMQARAHGSSGGLGGPSKEVAEEFIHKTPPDKRSKFAAALMKKKRGRT